MGQQSQTADTGAGAIEEVIVTAQKKSENLQDVPIAISAFSAQSIEDKAIDDGVDLSFSVPNLTVDQSGASLRGVGNLAISSTSEGGLGYHVNGVYIGSPASEAEYYDLERIEVLRGPQGTLYGRNTTAGVLNIITQKPTDELGGYLTGTYGNYDAVKLKGALNVPAGDMLAFRLAGFYQQRDGYTRNIFNGSDIDDRDMYGLRGSARLQLGDATTANLVLSYFEEDDRRSPLAKGVCTKDPLTGCSALSANFEAPDSRRTIFNTLGYAVGLLPRDAANAQQDYFAGAVNPHDLRTVNQDVDPSYYVRERNASLEITHDFGSLALTSLTGYQQLTRDVFNDFDRFAPTLGLTRPITFDAYANGQPITTTAIVSGRRDLSHAEQWFQELRLASSFDGPFNFLVGGNYYDNDFDIFVSITHPALAAVQQLRGFRPEFELFSIESNPTTTESYGFFGEGYFDLTSATRLTLGVRYSNDEKFILTRQVFLDPLPDGSVRPFTQGDFSKSVFTGRVVLDHEFSDALNGYVSLSRGYKAGGINPGGAVVPTFDPEFLNAAEIGVKGASRGGRFRANAAAFYYDYSDLQIGQVGVTSANTVNTDASVYGAELELVVNPVAALQFDVGFSYLHTQIEDFQSADEGDPNGIAPGTVPVLDAAGNVVLTSGGLVLKNLDGNELPFSPEWKIAAGVQYEIALGESYTLTPRIDHYEQGEFLGTAFNKPSETFGGYSQTDVKVLLRPDAGQWELRAFAKNVADNDDITRITQEGPLVGRFRSLFILEPRTYGLELTMRF